MKTTSFKPIFVASFPRNDEMKAGLIYVSVEYASVAHLCACGCGEKVITPLRPDSWFLTYNGREVSLSPSIGNYQFPCRSHYFIRGGRVEWVPDAPQRKRSWLDILFGRP